MKEMQIRSYRKTRAIVNRSGVVRHSSASSRLMAVALCSVILAAPHTLRAQSRAQQSPEAVVLAFQEALLSKNWLQCALLTDPNELRRTKSRFLPLFEADSTGRFAAAILGVPTQLRLSTLDSVEFSARLFSYFITKAPGSQVLGTFEGVEVLGSIAISTDSAVVLYRFRLPKAQPPLRSWQARLAVRSSDVWSVDMMADFSPLLTMLQQASLPIEPSQGVEQSP
jgi:hypothetical protein